MSIFYSADEVINMGVEIEKNGKNFYTRAAARFDDNEFKKLFTDLANWENEHILIFSDILAKTLKEMNREDFPEADSDAQKYIKAAADSHVFLANTDINSMVSGLNSAAEAVRLAMQFEKDSIVLYISLKKIVPEEFGQKHIDKLIDEEISHVKILQEKLNNI